MKLATFLVAFAGLNFVTASPMRTDLSAVPVLGSLKRGAVLSWDPSQAYNTRPAKRFQWERVCDPALTKAGCHVGVIHAGEIKTTGPKGEPTSYVNVEGAPETLPLGMEYPTKMRVFEDGRSEDGWLARDRKSMMKAKLNAQRKRPKFTEPWKGPKNLLSWSPVDTYEHHPARKTYWEKKCDPALSREGCSSGIIHMGETRVVRNGEKTTYINVEGFPSGLLGKENGKKLRVFQNGISEKGWSDRDLKLMAKGKAYAKRTRKLSQLGEGPKAVLSWHPVNSYQGQPKRKSYWEARCQVALTREGCRAGTMHKGETKTIRNGENTTYINVEGFPSMQSGKENGTELRVFQNSSVEKGWSAQDRYLMGLARYAVYGRRRQNQKNQIQPMGRSPKRQKSEMQPMGSMEASTSTQVPTVPVVVPAQVERERSPKHNTEETDAEMPADLPADMPAQVGRKRTRKQDRPTRASWR